MTRYIYILLQSFFTRLNYELDLTEWGKSVDGDRDKSVDGDRGNRIMVN